ncbi:hypothetical protein ACIQ2D_08555 [Lysinibacillus sp. NPDC097287]
MNKLEETTKELLEAGFTIEEITSAFEEVINKAKQVDIDKAADNN